MIQQRNQWLVSASLIVLVTACGGGGGGGGASGSLASQMDLSSVSNGFGEILPHTVFRLVDEKPTSTIIRIRSEQDLVDNVRASNPVRLVSPMPSNAILPGGQPGNQFLAARFTSDLDMASVLDASPGAQATQGATGAISVVALDPLDGSTVLIVGRYFIDGRTLAGAPTGSPAALPFQQWVELDGNGKPIAVDFGQNQMPGLGFPGTQADFAGSSDLIRPDTIIFVVDTDNNLMTHETFPTGKQIRMRITEAVRSVTGSQLVRPALAAATVGTDLIVPEVSLAPPPLATPRISPGNGDQNVDPLTAVRIEFSEPVQPLSIGDLDDGTPPTPSTAIFLEFGPTTARTQVPFVVKPVSVFDLSTYDLVPAFNFPGEGPSSQMCGIFNRVDVTINSSQFMDLSGNMNSLPAASFFVTGEGPALVNVPVLPDVVYIGHQGARAGLSVIDLNGFGQGTGSPLFDPTFTSFEPGFTNFPNNPNVLFQGSTMIPALSVGSCTFNGGSSGVFTLAKDSALESLVVREPLISSVGDIMIGQALDVVFNNGPAPFGCQSAGQGGGNNICAFEGNKVATIVVSNDTLIPAGINQTANATFVFGGPNLISWAPHPNPPPLSFPPPCVSPFIGGQEPTSVDSPGVNLLSNAGLSQPDVANGIPASGILAAQQNAFFQGPSLPQAQASGCTQFAIRQQIGHFLYVVDRSRSEIVVLNSNRMTVIDRIPLPDPTQLAMGPNLDLLAVTNQATDTVSFIDISPASSNFHKVIGTTVVGSAPSGIAWDSGNEDILVCNELGNSLSIIAASSLQVRKVASAQLNSPFDVAITPRQINFGLLRNVYFAYTINRNGKVAVFESGPDTVNGWGFDDLIQTLPFEFQNPKAIQPVHNDLRSAFWILHEGPISLETDDAGPLGEGALTYCAVTSGTTGVLFFTQNLGLPAARDFTITVVRSLGEDTLSGIPVDIAHDNQLNYGGAVNFSTAWSSGNPAQTNGKGIVRSGAPSPTPGPTGNTATAANFSRRIFIAVPFPSGGVGVVDVINIGTGQREDTNPYIPGVQSIIAPNAQVLSDYFRQ